MAPVCAVIAVIAPPARAPSAPNTVPASTPPAPDDDLEMFCAAK